MNKLKEFWSAYARQIIRFWTNQITMSVLGLSVGLATMLTKNLVIPIIGSVFSILFLCCIQYDYLFQLGNKDCYRSSAVIHPAKSLGLKIALLASVPLFLLIAVGLILRIASLESAVTVFKLIFYGLEGNYVQLHALIFEDLYALDWACFAEWGFFLLYTMPAILAGGLGYYLGAKDRTLRSLLIPGNNSGKKTGKS